MLRKARLATAGAIGCVGGLTLLRFGNMERSDISSDGEAIRQFCIFEVLKLAGKIARLQHDNSCRDFQGSQSKLLRDILKANSRTTYGIENGFQRILESGDVVATFREHHPLTKYEHWAPLVDRIARGEGNILNHEPEKMLAATSGTSGKRALLPVTDAMSLAFFKRGILIVFDVLNSTIPSALSLQRTCKLAFAPSWTYSIGGLPIGPNSSNPTDKNFRKLMLLYSSPAPCYKISHDEEAALYVHALFAAKDSKIGVIEANFCNMVYRLLSVLRVHGESIATDIERGQISTTMAARIGDAAVVAELETALGSGNAARARALRDALEGGERGLALRVWPKLRVILANATGSFESYGELLRNGFAEGIPILSTIYAASEGLMGIALTPEQTGHSGYCLVPKAMFFEFLPFVGCGNDEEITDVASKPLATLLAHELEDGRDYEVIVTTLGGLCRYRIGDVVRVVGHHFGAPVVEFRFRKGTILNLRGEKTTERHLEEAINAAFLSLHLSSSALISSNTDKSIIAEYATMETLPSNPFQLPYYKLYVECTQGTPPIDTAAASRAIDSALGEANPVYKTWRAKGAIGPCQITEVEAGAFEDLRLRRIAVDGASPQQLKPTRVLRIKAHEELLKNKKRNKAPFIC